jgi:hypothetical protein
MSTQAIIGSIIIFVAVFAMITAMVVAHKDHKKRVDEIIKNVKERKHTYKVPK